MDGCSEPTTLAKICKADMGSIKHFKGEVKVYKRVNYDWKYNMETQKNELKEDGSKGYLIVDKDTKFKAYSIPKSSIAENTPHLYIKKIDNMSKGDKI